MPSPHGGGVLLCMGGAPGDGWFLSQDSRPALRASRSSNSGPIWRTGRRPMGHGGAEGSPVPHMGTSPDGHRARGLGTGGVCRRSDNKKKSRPPFLRRKDEMGHSHSAQEQDALYGNLRANGRCVYYEGKPIVHAYMAAIYKERLCLLCQQREEKLYR